MRGRLHDLGRRAFQGPQLGVDGGGVAGGQGSQAHQAVHVDAIALVRGLPAGAGVRVVEVPLLLQVRHDVAQGGGGERPAQGAREALRAHGLARWTMWSWMIDLRTSRLRSSRGGFVIGPRAKYGPFNEL